MVFCENIETVWNGFPEFSHEVVGIQCMSDPMALAYALSHPYTPTPGISANDFHK